MSATCPLLFVYGTLRRDSAHPMARYLETVSRFLGRATTAGRLYDCGWHPAMTEAVHPTERVHGHLVELRDADSVLARLDEYEAEPPGFERRLVELATAEGRICKAWTYVFVRPLPFATWIESGDYNPGAKVPQ